MFAIQPDDKFGFIQKIFTKLTLSNVLQKITYRVS